MIGKLYFSSERFSDTYEIGYTFNRQYWNQGYASEAVKAFIKHAFTEMQVTRICALANVKNKRSCHLLEKLGFQKKDEKIGDCYYFILENNIVNPLDKRNKK